MPSARTTTWGKMRTTRGTRGQRRADEEGGTAWSERGRGATGGAEAEAPSVTRENPKETRVPRRRARRGTRVSNVGNSTHHVLALEQLLRDNGREATEEVPAAVDDDNLSESEEGR